MNLLPRAIDLRDRTEDDDEHRSYTPTRTNDGAGSHHCLGGEFVADILRCRPVSDSCGVRVRKESPPDRPVELRVEASRQPRQSCEQVVESLHAGASPDGDGRAWDTGPAGISRSAGYAPAGFSWTTTQSRSASVSWTAGLSGPANVSRTSERIRPQQSLWSSYDESLRATGQSLWNTISIWTADESLRDAIAVWSADQSLWHHESIWTVLQSVRDFTIRDAESAWRKPLWDAESLWRAESVRRNCDLSDAARI